MPKNENKVSDDDAKTIEVEHKLSIEDLCAETATEEVSIASKELPERRRWWDYLKSMQGEIIVLCYTLYAYMINPFVINLIKYKVCSTIHPQDMCFPELNDAVISQVQTIAANHIIAQALIKSTPSIVLAVLLGHWSDLHGRKFVIVLPLLGNAISTTLYLLNHKNPSWPPEYVVYSAIPSGLLGNYTGFMMGMFGWLKDSFDKEVLSLKIGIVDGIEMLMLLLGPLLGGLFYAYLGGYAAVFISAIVVLGAGFLVSLLFLHDKNIQKSSLKRKLLDFADIRNLKKTIKVLYVKRSERKRARMYLVLVIMIPIFMGFFGHHAILQNYAEAKLHWDVLKVTNFNCIQGVFAAVGCFITMPILEKLCKLGAVTMTAIGCMGYFAFYLGLAFSKTTESMYGVAIFQAIAIVVMITTRSYANICVENTEAGKLNSIIAVIQNVCRIAANSYGLALYQATIRSMPSAFYLITSVLVLFSMALSGILYMVEKAALTKAKIDGSTRAKTIF